MKFYLFAFIFSLTTIFSESFAQSLIHFNSFQVNISQSNEDSFESYVNDGEEFHLWVSGLAQQLMKKYEGTGIVLPSVRETQFKAFGYFKPTAPPVLKGEQIWVDFYSQIRRSIGGAIKWKHTMEITVSDGTTVTKSVQIVLSPDIFKREIQGEQISESQFFYILDRMNDSLLSSTQLTSESFTLHESILLNEYEVVGN